MKTAKSIFTLNSLKLYFVFCTLLFGFILKAQDGLVAFYPFNGNANDETGHGNNGIVDGPLLVADRFGNAQSAYYFDGADDNILIGDKFDNFQKMSITAWIKFDPQAQTSNYYSIISKHGDYGGYNGKSFNLNKKGSGIDLLSCRFYDSNKLIECKDVESPPLDHWIMLTVTFNEGIVKLYRDNILVDEEASSLTIQNTSTPTIIGDNATNDHPFFGSIDDVRIYNIELNLEEIEELFYENNNVIKSEFSANPLIGVFPLKVEFSDMSTGSIDSWMWDFDNDGIIDSELPCPEWVYNEPGYYSVALTVSNSSETDTEIKTDYIFVDDFWQCGYLIYDARNDQSYKTVLIGEQCWMAENINIGNKINGTLDMQDNNIIEKYCYEDLNANCDEYGGLYQWDELMQYSDEDESHGICPEGWHIPSQSEFEILAEFLGGYEISGGKLKTTGTLEEGTGLWHDPNVGATNEFGFSLLPAGNRRPGYFFEHQGDRGYFWTSTELNEDRVWYRRINFYNEALEGYSNTKEKGFSVRCLQNKLSMINLGNDTSACQGESIFLDAGIEGYTYLWSTGDTTQSIFVTETDNYSVIVSDGHNVVIDDINVTFNPVPIVEISDSKTIYVGYPPYETQLLASGGVEYLWSPNEGLSDPYISNPIAFPESSTYYKVLVTNEYGCVSSDSVFVEVIDVRCGNNMNKVLICHNQPNNPKTLCVSYNAVAAHLDHGDYLGPCSISKNTETGVNDIEKDYVFIAPNPFKTQAIIKLDLLTEQNIEIQVYSPEGKLIRILYQGIINAGKHEIIWDGTNNTGHNVNTGLYIVRITLNEEIIRYKLIKN